MVQKLQPEKTDRQKHRHTDRQTDGRTDMTENITYPHSRVIITDIKPLFAHVTSLENEK